METSAHNLLHADAHMRRRPRHDSRLRAGSDAQASDTFARKSLACRKNLQRSLGTRGIIPTIQSAHHPPTIWRGYADGGKATINARNAISTKSCRRAARHLSSPSHGYAARFSTFSSKPFDALHQSASGLAFSRRKLCAGNDPREEQINDPSNPAHYWCYRMHLTLDELLAADAFNSAMRQHICASGRN